MGQVEGKLLETLAPVMNASMQDRSGLPVSTAETQASLVDRALEQRSKGFIFVLALVRTFHDQGFSDAFDHKAYLKLLLDRYSHFVETEDCKVLWEGPGMTDMLDQSMIDEIEKMLNPE